MLLLAAVLAFGLYGTTYPGMWGMTGTHMSACPGVYGGYGGNSAYGAGTMHRGWYAGTAELNLSAEDVRATLERGLAWSGNPRLMAGEVRERDADVVIADIVTRENSLVERFLVDRKTGVWRPFVE